MIKDKELVIKETVQQSKDLSLKHLLRIMRSCVEARTPAKLSAALLDLNGEYDRSIREPTSNERSLTAEFAVFISLVLKAKLLSHYSDHRRSTDLMNRAAEFILLQKRVTILYNKDMGSYVKIGNLIFESPSNSIWTEAKSTAEEIIVGYCLAHNSGTKSSLHYCIQPSQISYCC